MANFCPKCGQPVNPGDAFCEKCGTKLRTSIPGAAGAAQAPGSGGFAQAPAQKRASAPESAGFAQQPAPAPANPHMGIPAPGYSSRVNDPEILRAMNKTK